MNGLTSSFILTTIDCLLDSYYLCKVGCETLRQRRCASLQPSNLLDSKSITSLLALLVQKAGDSINEDRNEAAVMHWSRDKNIGKKFTFFCFPQKKPSDYIPVYDEYKSLFSGCDKVQPATLWEDFPTSSSQRHQLGRTEKCLELSLHFSADQFGRGC